MPAHVEVGDDDVEVLGRRTLERLVGRACARSTVEAAPREARLEQLAHGSVVVDDEDAAAHGSVFLAGR